MDMTRRLFVKLTLGTVAGIATGKEVQLGPLPGSGKTLAALTAPQISPY